MSDTEILDALREVLDPELGINIVDLGLVYEVQQESGRVFIALTMTSPTCPMGALMQDQVQAAASGVPGVDQVEVKLVWDPPWHPGRMSEEARMMLGWLG